MRVLKRLIFTAFMVLSFHASQAHAQVIFEGCRDFSGIPVVSIEDNSVNDIAIASLSPYGPVIRFNRYVLMSTAPQTRVFFYAHECGHHALGHTVNSTHPLMVEQDADCFAIRYLVSKEVFNQTDVAVVQAELSLMAKGDWSHLPGTIRSINFAKCLARPPAVTFTKVTYVTSKNQQEDLTNDSDENEDAIDEKTGCRKYSGTPFAFIPSECVGVTKKSK